MNKYEQAYLNVDTNDCSEQDCELLQQACIKANVLDIIKKHKLLNYVLKNKKCAAMYHLSDNEIDIIKEWLENGL